MAISSRLQSEFARMAAVKAGEAAAAIVESAEVRRARIQRWNDVNAEQRSSNVVEAAIKEEYPDWQLATERDWALLVPIMTTVTATNARRRLIFVIRDVFQ